MEIHPKENVCLPDEKWVIATRWFVVVKYLSLSLWKAYVDPYCVHSWVVVFQSHNRGYRDTKLRPYMVFEVLCSPPVLFPRYLPHTTMYSTSGSPYSTTAADTCDPAKSKTSCYHHQFILVHPSSELPPHRGPESVTSQFTARLYYSSSVRMPQPPLILPPELPPPRGGTPIFCPDANEVSVPWSINIPYYGILPGPGLCGGSSPRLQPKYKNCLYHRLEEGPWHPRVWSLSSQDPCHMIPLLRFLLKVYHHCGPVIVQGYKHFSKVIEGWHQGEWAAIHPEIPFSALSQLLHGQYVPLPFRPPFLLYGFGLEVI